MANTYIKGVSGGETTTPTGDEGLPLDDGTSSTWIAIKNLIIRKLRETSGPTTLSMGDISDGQFLKRSGSSIIGATAKAYQTYNGHGLNGTIAAGATQYTPVGLWGLNATNYGFVTNRAGKVKNLYQRINSTQPATGSLVVTVYVNGVASSLVLTIAANSVSGVYSETSTEVTVAAGDAIVVGIKNNASGTSATIGANSLDFEYSVA